jgi:hypothetical protein
VREVHDGHDSAKARIRRACDGTAVPMTPDAAPFVASTPASANSSTRLRALHACLEAAQARARAGTMLRGTVFSVIAVLALLCGLEVVDLYFNSATSALPPGRFGNPFGYLAFCVAALVCALALAAILAFLFTPDLATLARAADRAFALQERLSTALEVEARLRPDAALDPVRAALLADAERHAAAIDPRRIVSLRWPRAGWTIPALIAAAVLLQLVPPEAAGLAALRGSRAAVERDGAGLTGQEGAAAAANLRRIAELLSADADERSDQYLRSIARTLERLSSEVERTKIDRQVLASELERLVAHTRQAYGQGANASNPVAPRDVARQLQAALDDIAGDRKVATINPPAPDDETAPDKAGAAAQDRTRRSAQPLERRAAGGQAPPETAPQDRRAAGRDDALKDLDDYDIVDPRIEKERAFAEQQRRARAASQSAGAAHDAGLGEGDRAGDGTRPLGNGGLTAANELAPGAEMLLPDQAAGSGRRIRLELAPEAALSGVAPPPAGNNGEWHRRQEQATERAALAPEGRKVVGRYFSRSAGGRAP